jgi:hypothetical protein
MSEASVFRLYAEEAMRASTKAEREDEKQALRDLACTWAKAAVASEKVFGATPTLSAGDPRPTPPPHS